MNLNNYLYMQNFLLEEKIRNRYNKNQNKSLGVNNDFYYIQKFR